MKRMKWIGMLAALLAVTMLATACGSDDKKNDPNDNKNPSQGTQNGDTTPDPDINIEQSMLITLNDDQTDVGKSGASFENDVLRITKAGTYRLKGKLSDGQVYITVEKNEAVDLILDGCTITCKTGAAIYCDSADKLYITVNKGTENVLSDGYNYIYSQIGADEPNACVFSDDDITLRGSGTLTVNGNFKNGISSKNDIKIKDLTLMVNAANTGLRGKDSVEINSGKVTVVAEKDGIKVTQTEKADKGFIEISGGTVDVTAGDDAFQATVRIAVNAGKVSAASEGKNFNCDGEVFTAEGTFTEK